MSCGSWVAAVLIETLSAPALRRRRTSSTLRTPPPTVSGMNTWPATASTTCRMRSRSSELAVISRKASSDDRVLNVQDEVADIGARSDIEEGQLVGALLVV